MWGELIEKYQIFYQAIFGIRNGDDFVLLVYGVIFNGVLIIVFFVFCFFVFCFDIVYQFLLIDYIYGVDLLYYEVIFL